MASAVVPDCKLQRLRVPLQDVATKQGRQVMTLSECAECAKLDDESCHRCTRNSLRHHGWLNPIGRDGLGMPLRDLTKPSGYFCRGDDECRECAAERGESHED